MKKDIEIFIKKNEYLLNEFDEVDYKTFYRDLFPLGSFERKGMYEDNKGNGIAVAIEDKNFYRTTITDEHDQLDDLIENNFVVTNGISYFGNERSMNNATLLYALIFDIDGVCEENHLFNLINHFKTEITPRPTYVVNSGHGFHLYFVFKEPILLYNHMKEPLKQMKYNLTGLIWNQYISNIKEVQYQGINQAFRMVGSPTKFGKQHRLTAFKTGSKIDLNYLNQFVFDEDKKVLTTEYESTLTLEQAKEKYPDWYERKIIKKQKNKSWTVNRNLYDWWIRQVKEGATFGHRYFCIMALSIYAIKCDIPFHELQKDAYDLIPHLNNINEKEPFTKEDVNSALKAYDKSYKNFPREDIEKITSIDIPKNKRNYQKQSDHLEIARAIRDVKMRQQNKVWWNEDGRPVGSGTKENEVKEWRTQNPKGTKAQCNRDTGIDPKTIRKWWTLFNGG